MVSFYEKTNAFIEQTQYKTLIREREERIIVSQITQQHCTKNEVFH